MKSLKNAPSPIQPLTAKEQLELIEKKVEIRKKRIEIKKEQLGIDEILFKRTLALENQKLLIDKIAELRHLLSDITVDEERTVVGGEPFLTRTFTGRSKCIITNKLLELIQKLN